MFELANWSESFNEFGKIKKTFSFKTSNLGIFSLVTFSKLVFDERSSVFALIKSALAPAKEDSDWAKSVKVISPFWSLALSESTCLSKRLTFVKLNFSFLDLKIKSKYAEVVSKIVCCSTFFSFKFALWVSNSDFWKVLKPLKPEKIFWSTEIFLLSESELESAKLEPFWSILLVEVMLETF